MLQSFLALWPSLTSLVLGAVWGCLFLVAAAGLAGELARRGWRVGDTRKVFHVIIFTAAGVLRGRVDAGAVTVYGCVVATGVLYAVSRGSASRLYQALARPTDHPYEKLHILSPLAATAIGGVLAQAIAGPLASVAYLVAGWGDAVGEPIGIRWGWHRYRVPGWRALKVTRSWEGSAAVLISSTVAAGIGLTLAGEGGPSALVLAAAIGLGATVIEAMSPHGWDNLTLLVGTALLTRVLVS